LEHLHDLAKAALPALLVVFMAGNLAAIGLEVDFRAAMAPLRDLRFIVVVMLWDWLLCPGFALLLAALVPMARPYAVGLVLIGLAPAAPFLPMMVRRAGGDMAYTAGFMLIAAVGTVIFMPLALPVVIPSLAIDAWSIAKPLLLLLLLPLLVGLGIRAWMPPIARSLERAVKGLANLATFGLLAAVLILHFDGFVEAVGSYAIGTQLLYAIGLTVGAWYLSFALPAAQRSVVSLGVCTRNLGAALSPLLVVEPDPRTTVMVAMGVPITLIVTYVAARLFERRVDTSKPGHLPETAK
jgi:BASS family bile acid:Na+ symporter